MKDHLDGHGPYSVSFSELSTLAQCEHKWYERYVLRKDDAPTLPMRFGTVLHAAIADWWVTGQRRPAWYHAANEHVDLPEEDDRSLDNADWLTHRYAEHYARTREDVEVVDTELELESELVVDDISYTIVSHIDQLFSWAGQLVAVERKSMRDWRRLESVQYDPQQTLYDWQLRNNGYRIDYTWFDAIKTYRWTRDEHKHPPADSFRPVVLFKDDDQREGALDWARAILRRRAELYPHPLRPSIALGSPTDLNPYGPASPIRNMGTPCQGCAFIESCYEGMAFDVGVTVEDDDA